MGLRFRSNFIFTTTARIDTSPTRVWRVLMATSDWPGWWLSVARCDAATAPSARPQQALHGGRWRLAWGLPLQLNMVTVAREWPDWLTLRLQGDLQGQLTFAVQPTCSPDDDTLPGVELTCRCELPGVLVGLWPWRLLLERRMGQLAQTLVRDLGRVLHCHARVLSHWQGCAWRG